VAFAFVNPMKKETISVRVEKPLRRDIDEFREENKISEADAVRYLLARGLEYQELEERVESLEKNIDRLQGQIDQQSQIIKEQQEELKECREKSLWDFLLP
jgi:peptidoglycan hydrolase CwlO-like protein